MTALDWRQLAITSVKDPASAAPTLMAMGFPTQALWSALVLVAVVNAMLFTLSDLLFPGPSPLPEFFSSPLVYFVVVAVGLSLTVVSLFWTGRFMGGKGELADVLVLIVWMQTLRVLVQGAAIVLMVVAPILSALLVFAAALIGVYMFVHFVDQAHRFGSVGRAAVVLIASFLAIVVGLSVLLTLIAG
jgi:hypothetical protein